jgi:hypothetical protein
MKKLLIKSVLTIVLFTGITSAQTDGFGLGIIVGQPTGLSAKYWLSSNNALDFGLGYSFEKNSRMSLHVDYLFHARNLFNTSENISLHYGPGGRLRLVEDGESRLGVRFDVGLTWVPRNSPVDVFLEIAPLLDIIPETKFSFNGGIGVRYYFK